MVSGEPKEVGHQKIAVTDNQWISAYKIRTKRKIIGLMTTVIEHNDARTQIPIVVVAPQAPPVPDINSAKRPRHGEQIGETLVGNSKRIQAMLSKETYIQIRTLSIKLAAQ